MMVQIASKQTGWAYPFLKRIGGYTQFLLWTLQLINIRLSYLLFPTLHYEIYSIRTSFRSEKNIISSYCVKYVLICYK